MYFSSVHFSRIELGTGLRAETQYRFLFCNTEDTLKPTILHENMLSHTVSQLFFSNILKILSSALLLQIEKVIGTNVLLALRYLQFHLEIGEIAEDINQHKMYYFIQ